MKSFRKSEINYIKWRLNLRMKKKLTKDKLRYLTYQHLSDESKQKAEILLQDNMEAIYYLTNKYQDMNCYNDLVQDCTIELLLLCSEWNNQFDTFSSYIFTNLKSRIYRFFKKEEKYLDTNSIDDYPDLEKLDFLQDEDNHSEVYIKRIKEYPDYAISENGKVINMITINEMKQNEHGWVYFRVNGKSKGLKVSNLMNEYYPTGERIYE